MTDHTVIIPVTQDPDPAVAQAREQASAAAFEQGAVRSEHVDPKTKQRTVVQGEPKSAAQRLEEAIVAAEAEGEADEPLKPKSAAPVAAPAAPKPEPKAEPAKTTTTPKIAGAMARFNEDLIANNGTFSEGARKELTEKLGIDPELVDAFQENWTLALKSSMMLAEREVGGEEAYAAMVEWSKKMPKEELAMISEGLRSRKEDRVIAAARALKRAYYESNGREARLLSGTRGPAREVDGERFENDQEMWAWQSHRLYRAPGPDGDAFRAAFDKRYQATYGKSARAS